MKSKYYLFLDLDGTLLNDRKEITEGNRKAIDDAIERGHAVTITTGRPLKSAIQQSHKLGMDKPGCLLIAYNGAMIYDWATQEICFSKTLPIETAIQVFQEANRRGIHVQTYDKWDVLVEPRCDDEAVRRYCSLISMEHKVIGDVGIDLTEEPVKVLAIDFDEQAKLLEFQNWLRANMADKVDCYFSCSQYLEIVPVGMTKGYAVKKLCEMVGVSVEQAIAVGDAANDLSMIEAAGIGVAMANGTEEVKSIANYITINDNNHDGIAEVIQHFMA